MKACLGSPSRRLSYRVERRAPMGRRSEWCEGHRQGVQSDLQPTEVTHASDSRRRRPVQSGLERARACVQVRRRARRDRRCRRARVATRSGRATGLHRHARHRGRPADGAGHDLLHRLDDEADHQRRRVDAGRGRQAAPRRPGLALHPGIRRRDGLRRCRRRARQAGAPRPADHGPPPADAHVRAVRRSAASDARAGLRQSR